MDPKACFEMFLSAVDSGDLESAEEHGANLLAWLGGGGFKPQHALWVPDSSRKPNRWCKARLQAYVETVREELETWS